MKLIVNYDLLEKLVEANTGFSVNKSAKLILTCTTFSTFLNIILDYLLLSKNDNLLDYITFHLIFHTIIEGIRSTTSVKLKKYLALGELIILANRLKDINVNTNHELLLESYKYKTEYKLNFNNKQLEEKKYIMIPVFENGFEKEVSLVQEHIVGSNQYSLSYGEADKVLKLAFNKI